jgi:glycosyltransferase involved in cell wall biosynthesis
VLERQQQFNQLVQEFNRQIELNKYQDIVEVCSISDNKQMTIGAKRQKLLDMAAGEYVVFFDDDDWPEAYYVAEVVAALETKPDCIGMLIRMTTNGRQPQMCCHSLQFPEWKDNYAGYDYVRNVTHFNPVKSYIAKLVGFSDKRFGEDKEYSDKVTKLCKDEVFINKPMFHYRYTTHVPHNQKYGFTK